ncbi:MAG: FIST C-terminal domain-containing protein, partial [Synergistaceae bacterium]|nr:FIST C-terminal domain-containing protein [Synergistaceae bacterium]
ETKNFTQKAAITGAKGNKLISINNMPAVDYMKKIGFKGLTYASYHAIPLLIDGGDGLEPTLFVASSVAPNGALVVSGTVSPGGTLMVGAYTSEEVLSTAKKLIDSVKKAGEEKVEKVEKKDRKTVLIFSCMSRKTVLYDSRVEMKFVRRELEKAGLSYLFTYSGGEFCPWLDPQNSKKSNRFHNFVIVACLF